RSALRKNSSGQQRGETKMKMMTEISLRSNAGIGARPFGRITERIINRVRFFGSAPGSRTLKRPEGRAPLPGAWGVTPNLWLGLLLLATGCHTTTRSISNSGYQEACGNLVSPSLELSEFDVLGIEPGQLVSEEEIAAAGANARHVNLREGS